VPGIAFADVPPPDSCNAPGQACNTAPPDYQSPGICVSSMCTKAGPDGSFEVPCNLCKPDDGGGTGGSGTGGSGTGGSGTGGSSTGGSSTGGSSSGSSSDDDGGCSFKGAPARGALALSLLALGLGALAFDRRRRR
jgi:hypothetical protein